MADCPTTSTLGRLIRRTLVQFLRRHAELCGLRNSVPATEPLQVLPVFSSLRKRRERDMSLETTAATLMTVVFASPRTGTPPSKASRPRCTGADNRADGASVSIAVRGSEFGDVAARTRPIRPATAGASGASSR